MKRLVLASAMIVGGCSPDKLQKLDSPPPGYNLWKIDVEGTRYTVLSKFGEGITVLKTEPITKKDDP